MKATVLEEFPLSMRDLARKLGKSYEWTRIMVNKGGIKQVWISPRAVRFKQEWVDDYLAKNTWDPKKDGGAKE